MSLTRAFRYASRPEFFQVCLLSNLPLMHSNSIICCCVSWDILLETRHSKTFNPEETQYIFFLCILELIQCYHIFLLYRNSFLKKKHLNVALIRCIRLMIGLQIYHRRGFLNAVPKKKTLIICQKFSGNVTICDKEF